MGKRVQHETVTTFICDKCGKEDISANSTTCETDELPVGWCCALVFDRRQPPMNLAGRRWDHEYETIEMLLKGIPLVTQTWCGGCRKALGIPVGDTAPDGHVQKLRWFERFIAWCKS